MKKRITALLCLMTLCINTVAFAETVDKDEETSNTVSANAAEVSDNTEILEEIQVTAAEASVRDELKRIIEEYKKTEYTDVADEDSVQKMNTVLETAKAVCDNENAADEEILRAVEDLKQAAAEMTYIEPTAIITNNKLTDKNKNDYYPEMIGEDPSLTIIETAVAYTYEDDSPLKTGDSTNKKLSDGIGTEFMTTDGTNNSVIIYDLGADYYISGIDVFSKFAYFAPDKSMRWNMAGYTVEVSGDGGSYDCVAEIKARTELLEDNTMGYEYEVLKTPAVFPAVSARFVKITILADAENSSQYNLDEIVIKGFKSPFSRDDLYNAIVKCSGVDKSIYTAESYANYLAAYNRASEVYWDNSASGLVVYNAKTELEKAFESLESNAKIVILSGNVLTDFDKTQYEGFANDKLKKLSYSYIKFDGKDSNPQIAETDASCNKLLQGNMAAYETSSDLAFGTWDSANPANILFNLGEECYVSGVDVWERYAGAATRAGKISVYISDDGVNFEKVSETEGTKTEDETCANKIAQDFEPVKGRYLLVVAQKRDGSHQVTLNEVVIKGFKTGQRDNIPFFIENSDYKTTDGIRITSIDGAGEITVSGTAVSNCELSGEVVVITAAYKNNDIVDWSFDTVNVDSYGSAEFENTIDLNGETGVKLVSYVWNSLEERKPLSAIKEFGSL